MADTLPTVSASQDPLSYGDATRPVRQDPTQYIIDVHWGGGIVVAEIPDFMYLLPLNQDDLPDDELPTDGPPPSGKFALGDTFTEAQYTIDLHTTATTATSQPDLLDLASTAGLQVGKTYAISGPTLDTGTFFTWNGDDTGTLDPPATDTGVDVPVRIYHWLFEPLDEFGTERQLDVYSTRLRVGDTYPEYPFPINPFLAFDTAGTFICEGNEPYDVAHWLATFADGVPPRVSADYYLPTWELGPPAPVLFYNGVRLADSDQIGIPDPAGFCVGGHATATGWTGGLVGAFAGGGEPSNIRVWQVFFPIDDHTVTYIVDTTIVDHVGIIQFSDGFAPGYFADHGVTLRGYSGNPTLKIATTGHVVAVDAQGAIILPDWSAIKVKGLTSMPDADSQIGEFDGSGLL